MKTYRTFCHAFKAKLVDEMISGTSTGAALSRKYNIPCTVLYRWKRKYLRDKLINNHSNKTCYKEDKVVQLEQMVVRLITENEILKKALGSV